MEITFLGHQTWLVTVGKTRILVDPILRDSFGASNNKGFQIYPPRAIDTHRLKDIDAVFLSHEHSLPYLKILLVKVEYVITVNGIPMNIINSDIILPVFEPKNRLGRETVGRSLGNGRGYFYYVPSKSPYPIVLIRVNEKKITFPNEVDFPAIHVSFCVS